MLIVLVFLVVPVTIVLVETSVFWLLAKILLDGLKGSQLQGIRGFSRILPFTSIANIMSLFILFSITNFFFSLGIPMPLPFYFTNFIVVTLFEWWVYTLSFRGFSFRQLTSRISKLLIISLAANIVTYAPCAYVSAPRVSPRLRVPYTQEMEARINLAAIRTCQEAYKYKNGVYLECKPSPTNGGTDVERDKWNDNGGFAEIGFEPEYGFVRHRYAVKVSDDGQSFVAIAVFDIDEDGRTSAWVVDTSSPNYPKAEKDTAGIYSDGDDY